MVYKLGNIADMSKLPSVDEKITKVILDNLNILEENYGKDRDINEDDGGYILYAEPKTMVNEVLSYFDYEEYLPEFVLRIDSTPPYCKSLYLTSDEFGIIILTAMDDTPEDVLEEMTKR